MKQIKGRALPILTDWTKYTPTFTGFGTVNTFEFFWRRVGDTCEIKGRWTSGTQTATEARVSLPAGVSSAGTDRIHSALELAGSTTDDAANAFYVHVLLEPSKTYLVFGAKDGTAAGFTKINGNTWSNTNGRLMGLRATVPVAGWKANRRIG